MLKIKLFALCDNSILDKQGKISLIGIFDTIFASTYPAAHSKFDAVTIMQGKKGDYTEKLRIKSPGGQLIAESDTISFNIRGDGDRAQFINSFQNTILPEKGDYTVEIILDGEVKDTETFKVAPPLS